MCLYFLHLSVLVFLHPRGRDGGGEHPPECPAKLGTALSPSLSLILRLPLRQGELSPPSPAGVGSGGRGGKSRRLLGWELGHPERWERWERWEPGR